MVKNRFCRDVRVERLSESYNWKFPVLIVVALEQISKAKIGYTTAFYSDDQCTRRLKSKIVWHDSQMESWVTVPNLDNTFYLGYGGSVIGVWWHEFKARLKRLFT